MRRPQSVNSRAASRWLACGLHSDVFLRRHSLFGNGHRHGQDALVIGGFDVVFLSAARQRDRADERAVGKPQCSLAVFFLAVFFRLVFFVRGPAGQECSGSPRSTRHKIRVSDGHDNGVSGTELVSQCFKPVP